MLPDLPALKRRLLQQQRRRMDEATVMHAPLFADVKVFQTREGDRWSHQRDDGEIVHQRPKAFRSPITTKILDAPLAQQQEIVRQMDGAAEDMARQQSGLLFTTITESSQRAGTAYDAGGKPFHMSMFLDLLESMHIDFDESGKVRLPTIVMHPKQMQFIRDHLKEWEADSALRRRWNEVLAKKKEEWRAREADRTLVG